MREILRSWSARQTDLEATMLTFLRAKLNGEGMYSKGKGSLFLPWKKIRNMTNQMMHLPTVFGSSFLQQSGFPKWHYAMSLVHIHVDEIPPSAGGKS